MNLGFLDKIKRALQAEPPLHPVEGRLAKRDIKRRLALLFPELRNNPEALEAAYQALDLKPRLGTEEGDAPAYFEMTLPQ